MTAHVVQSGAGRARRYLAAAGPADEPKPARPPLVWADDAACALAFPTPADARIFAMDALGHALFDVGPAPSRRTA